MTIEPGRLRIRSASPDGYAVGHDCEVEVQQADGSWLKLQGITRADIIIRPDDLVRVKLDVLVASIDLENIPAAWVRVEHEPVVLPS